MWRIKYNRIADAIDKKYFYIGRTSGNDVVSKLDEQYLKLNKRFSRWI